MEIANGMAKTYSSDGRLLSETPYEKWKRKMENIKDTIQMEM